MSDQYDVVIIGAGLGGLLCAVMLAKEGMKVAVVEQNKQVGGCLQTFSFDKKVFDSCVHYIGAMDEGQTQRRIFDYAGISASLAFRRLDLDGFDRIAVGDRPELYPQAQGMDNFEAQLIAHFPHAAAPLKAYTNLLRKTGDSFPLFRLRNGTAAEKQEVSTWPLEQTLQQTLKDPLLVNAIAGNSLLYAGDAATTPFYVHALVTQSYIESAWKCDGASSQISKALWKQLQHFGGTIIRSQKIVKLHTAQGLVTKAVAESGQEFYARNFIANVHPAQMLQWLDEDAVKVAYRKRVQAAANSVSSFMVNMVLQPGKVPYRNHNIYWNRSLDPFAALQDCQHSFANYALYFSEDKQQPGFADTVAILAYMPEEQTRLWADTENRTAAPADRGEGYLEFKEGKAQELMQLVAQRFPEIIQYTKSLKVASPLTFRDYMGTSDGAMYGIVADVNHPERSRVPVRTKIPNLLLTGQNINLHGVLGVSVTAVATCGELLGLDYLLQKINNT